MFKSNCRGVEQLVARKAHNLEVAGSNPVPANGFTRVNPFPLQQPVRETVLAVVV